MKENQTEFYIGWQPQAPDGFARRIRLFILAMCILVPATVVTLVLSQGGFAHSIFELGQVTSVEGVLIKSPAPFLQISRGQTSDGEPVYQHILLVAPGKHGINVVLAAREAELGYSLEGRRVTLQGFLIYHDGKTLMEVGHMSDIGDKGTPIAEVMLPARQGLGTVVGEITDPKCLFGVMKPGHGKPHRSCAARCIAGGIPPVLKTVSVEGHISYYIIAGEEGGPANREVLPFVGDQVAICGEIRTLGEWMVLYKDADKKIVLVSENGDKDMAMCR
jgi:hypothetical protein